MALDIVAVVVARAGEADHLPGHHVPVSAVDRVGEEAFHRVAQQLIEEDELDSEENLILYGLDSLRIMQFSSELKAQGINISFEELGRTPTLSNWWSLVDARQRIAG